MHKSGSSLSFPFRFLLFSCMVLLAGAISACGGNVSSNEAEAGENCPTNEERCAARQNLPL